MFFCCSVACLFGWPRNHEAKKIFLLYRVCVPVFVCWKVTDAQPWYKTIGEGLATFRNLRGIGSSLEHTYDCVYVFHLYRTKN